MTELLPNLLVIGAKKAGTTLLHKMLDMHPRVFMSEEKEPHYLVLKNFDAWSCAEGSQPIQSRRSRARARHSYLELFREAPLDGLYRGESSTGYTTHPSNGPVPRFIRQMLGQPKMIYLLRDPVARMVSNYRHSYLIGAYPSGMRFGDAIEWDGILTDTSRYSMQIDEYEKEFGPDCLHITISEKLTSAPGMTMKGIAEYLNLDTIEEWYEVPDRVNSQEQVGQIVSVCDRFGGTTTNIVRRFIPRGWRGFIKSKVSGVVQQVDEAPLVSDEDRSNALQAVADDLERLHARLGKRIESWQSVKTLMNASS